MWGDFGGSNRRPLWSTNASVPKPWAEAILSEINFPRVGGSIPPLINLSAPFTSQCAAVDSFYEGSAPLPQVGIICPHYPGHDETASGKSEEGVVQMCEETHYESVILDDAGDLADLELVILPDSVVVTPQAQVAPRKLLSRRRPADSLSLFWIRRGRQLGPSISCR